METATPASEAPAPVELPVADIRAGQNFGLAILAGLVAAIGGALLWAIVTVVTKWELGVMAIAVGYLVGQAIKAAGKGIDKKFGYLGVVCGLLGCVLGNVLSDLVFFAQSEQMPLSQLAQDVDAGILVMIVRGFFNPMDLVFYAIAAYEAYKFSFKYKLVKKVVAATPAS